MFLCAIIILKSLWKGGKTLDKEFPYIICERCGDRMYNRRYWKKDYCETCLDDAICEFEFHLRSLLTEYNVELVADDVGTIFILYDDEENRLKVFTKKI